MAITVISYAPVGHSYFHTPPSVIVTFIRPPPFGVLPRSARLPYLFSPKGPRLEGELASRSAFDGKETAPPLR